MGHEKVTEMKKLPGIVVVLLLCLLSSARADEAKPVKVDGTLEVYAFDETDRDPTNSAPDRKYVFSPEDFRKHFSEGKLGDAELKRV